MSAPAQAAPEVNAIMLDAAASKTTAMEKAKLDLIWKKRVNTWPILI